ncbi:outer membrane biogenesis protein BamB [Rubripirellula amarantea]|uniref:Outer membrane biogenesis protein BamB n=1 Tax=Rubripirellula amarantea TaxID=2527999 RepID=A0A5C5WM57_9BACT|nr:PQQ-binding-like beta-propeller repeat protein [Rubripirellula amarantea]TWT51171.1 outer membrane biogenesis protein BamB [Rubripirellula amarantea]
MQRPFVAAFITALALVPSLVWVPSSAVAQELMPSHVAAKLGLVESWTRTVTAPMGTQSISDLLLHVHDADPNEYVEVVASQPGAKASPATGKSAADETKEGGAESDVDNVRVMSRIWTNQADRLGEPIGLAEAERLAKNEVRRLKRYGIEASIRTTQSPRVRLYSVSNDGTLEARDAETGAVIWMTRVGNRKLNFGGLGVDDQLLTVINGTNLIVVDATNGEVVKELRLRRPPLFGAINSGDYVMVLGIGGDVDSYLLSDLERDIFYSSFQGRALAPPVKAPGDSTKVVWATDAHFIYGMELQGKPSIQFRFATDGMVSGKLARASGDRFFFGTDNGQVYGIRANRTGEVLWSQPFGEPFYDEPVIFGDQLFIRSAYGTLYCVSVATGEPIWDQPAKSVDELIGAVGKGLFVRSTSGAMAVIDQKTGDRVELFRSLRPGRLLKNTLTNRLYLVSENGVIQCLRPEDAELPTLNIQPDSSEEEAADAGEGDAKPESEEAAQPDTMDPFGAGASDPFGAGASDPFGAGDGGMSDPFGSGAGESSDPFADPFGG